MFPQRISILLNIAPIKSFERCIADLGARLVWYLRASPGGVGKRGLEGVLEGLRLYLGGE